MPLLVSFAVGALFAVGLGVSGMTQPEKVIGFLDFFGAWDPALVFVMGGAVVTYALFYRVVRGAAPVLTQHFQLPTRTQIDARLVVGSGLFGVGWGLAGFCPGPALVSIGNGAREALIFVAAMIAGMYLWAAADRLLGASGSRARAASATASND